MNGVLFTQHVYMDMHSQWVHIVSVSPIDDRVASALLYANDVLCAQFGVRTHRYIQPCHGFGDGMLETELGVAILRYPDLSEGSDVFLMSGALYSDFSMFMRELDKHQDLEALLSSYHKHKGLICGLVLSGQAEEAHTHAHDHAH